MTDQEAPAAPAPAPRFFEGFCAERARPFILAAAILASAIGFIDGTVVAIAMPAIRASLDATLEQAQWVHNAYMLTLSSLILAGGAMGDRFGLARVFGAGIALFVGASLLCAVAPNASFLILARAVQGIGAAIMVPGSLAIIARAYPREIRGRAIGIWAAASALTTALGPIIGGLALSLGGPEMWRWIFAVNLPLGGLALYLLASRVRADRVAAGTPIDIAGAALATIALLGLAWGLTEGGAGAAIWIGGGAVAAAAFLWVEARARDPMMPLDLFRSARFSAANILSFALYSAISIVFFFMPMTLVAGWGLREIDASLAFAPMAVFIGLLSTPMGSLADRVGPAPFLAVGSLVVAAGFALMALTVADQAFATGILPGMCLVGLGMSMVVAPLSAVVMGAVSDDRSGVASGINNAVTRMAGLVSVAAIGGLVAGSYAAAGGEGSFGLATGAESDAAAMSAGFEAVLWVAVILSLVSAVAALPTAERGRAKAA